MLTAYGIDSEDVKRGLPYTGDVADTAAPVPRRYQLPYRVRFDEAGPDGLLRSSGYLRYAQDLAWQHSEAAGFDRAWYRERGLQWLVRCIDLEIRDPLQYGAVVTVSTEVVGWRRVWARRRSEFRAGGGDLVSLAFIDWVLLNAEGRPARVPPAFADFFSDGTSFTPGHVILAAPPDMAQTVGLRVRPQDLDPMGHVNNATYLDYVEAACLDGGCADAVQGLPRRFRLEYVRSAQPGDELIARTWPDEGGQAVRLATADGEEILRARLGGR